jgi:hypothetical protein
VELESRKVKASDLKLNLNSLLTSTLDLALVQDHLDKLRKTKRPPPSLHHMLADRLEAWLQNMNMSPTMNFTQPVFDPTWSLFDQNSIQIAAGPKYRQGDFDAEPALNDAANALHSHCAPMNLEQQQSYDEPGFWNVYGDATTSWPSGLTRLFGNAAYQETTNSEHVQ